MTNPSIAVVGGGTLGLYVAARLSGRGAVTVFEPSFGDYSRAGTKLLGPNHDIGTHDGARSAWMSAWGGTSTIWGGQLLPWEEWETDGTLYAQWPARFGPNSPDYARVLRALGLPNAHSQIHSGQFPSVLGDTSDIHVRVSTWIDSRRRNFATNPALLSHLKQVEMVDGKMVLSIRGSGPFTVEFAESASSVPRVRVFDRVILAAGVFGNVRLVRGISDSPAIGSGFMDHVSARYASYEVSDWKKFRRAAAQRYVGGVRTSIKLVPQPVWVDRAQSLPGYAHWEFDLSQSALLGSRGARPLRQMHRIGKEAVAAAAATVDAIRLRSRPLPSFVAPYLRVDVEQRPATRRRIRWSGDGASLSMGLDWDVSDSERRSIALIGEAVSEYLEAVEVGARLRSRVEDEPRDIKHLMGGTPMGKSSLDSVVDSFGRVHGMSDAWVVGASIFPSGGVANPTFTALMLAERLVRSSE